MSNETYTDAPLLGENEVDFDEATNDAIRPLGSAQDAVLDAALTSNAATVAVDDLKAARVLKPTGTLTGAGTVTIAAALTKWFLLENATTGAYNLTVKVSGETGVVLGPETQGLTILLRVDGTDVVKVSAESAADFLTAASEGSLPGTGIAGRLYIVDDTRHMYLWNGSGWYDLSERTVEDIYTATTVGKAVMNAVDGPAGLAALGLGVDTVADATDGTDVITQLNALLDALRTRGVLDT